MYTLGLADVFATTEPPDTYVYDIVPVSAGLASISSDSALQLLDPLLLNRPTLQSIRRVHDEVTCLKALDAGNSIVCTAGRDGCVGLVDFRVGAKVGEVRVDKNVPVLSLATSASSFSIAAGTELSNSQASVAIWDTRTLRNPQQYVESHSDDITELQFHPITPSILLSGSTDGLVNIYNTAVRDEDDALHQTINHGSSIHSAGFLADGAAIFALSHDEKFAVYGLVTDPDADDGEEGAAEFGDLREALGCEYVVNCLPRPGGGGVIGAGKHSESRMELVQLRDDRPWRLVKEERVAIERAHGEEIVRAFCFLDEHRMVLTAGEDGKIKAWKSQYE